MPPLDQESYAEGRAMFKRGGTLHELVTTTTGELDNEEKEMGRVVGFADALIDLIRSIPGVR